MKTILVDAVHCFVVKSGDGYEIFKEMQDLLDSFPNKKIALTGANDIEFKKFNLSRIAYPVFTLKHNPEKTDPKYYEILLKQFGLSKDEVIYFEHAPAAVASAESVGIKTYFYNSEKPDLDALKRWIQDNL